MEMQRLSLHQVNSCVPKGKCLNTIFSRGMRVARALQSLRPSCTFYPGHSHQHEAVTRKTWEHSRVRVTRTISDSWTGIRSCSQNPTVSKWKDPYDHIVSLSEPGCICLGTTLIFQVGFFQSLLCKHPTGTYMLLPTCTHIRITKKWF